MKLPTTLFGAVLAVALLALLAAAWLAWPRSPWSAGEQAAIESLWIGNLGPVPPDPSNRVADDPAAAALGERLFFDARFSATARHYLYRILTRRAPPALDRNRVWWLTGRLDADAMREAAALLIGRHDFTTFRAAQCQARSPMRELQELELRRTGAFIVVSCRANAFLHHMVRNLVGSLVRIGRGEERPEWLRAVLDSRDRRAAGMTAAACGLYLAHVHYPAAADMPAPGRFPPGDP